MISYGVAFHSAMLTEFDECDTGYQDCAEEATCVNTDDGYKCQCPPGLQGDVARTAEVQHPPLANGRQCIGQFWLLSTPRLANIQCLQNQYMQHPMHAACNIYGNTKYLIHSLCSAPNVYNTKCLNRSLCTSPKVHSTQCVQHPMYAAPNMYSTKCLNHSLCITLYVHNT